jgi:hypothetical protein
MKHSFKTLFAVSIILASMGSLSSCGSRNAEDDKRQAIIESFVVAHKAFVRTNPAQENFFSKFTAGIDALSENRNAVIDTKELDSLLAFAKEVNARRRQMVNEKVVQDSAILYHDKANELINTTDSFYQKIPGLIQILRTTGETRYDEYQKLMAEPLKQMRIAQEAYQHASEDMAKKYSIKVTN